MAWYEAQIIGVAVGGLLGIGSNIFFSYLNEKKLKKSLLAGLRSEIKFLQHVAERGATEFKKYKDEVEKEGEIKTFYKHTGDFEFHFLDKNLDKIGVLDEKFLTPLIALRQTSIALTTGLKITFETARIVKDNKKLIKIHITQLSQAIATFNQVKELCDKFLSIRV
jgi:gas vesicle protein